MNTPTRPATPDDDRPIEHVALRAPRLPTFFAYPIAGFAADDEPADTVPDNEPPRSLTTEERIAALQEERKTASIARQRVIDDELEALEMRREYEKSGRVSW